jgi:hypothetical protein
MAVSGSFRSEGLLKIEALPLKYALQAELLRHCWKESSKRKKRFNDGRGVSGVAER